MKRQELIDQMPPGLTRTVGRILDFHRGKDNAITKSQLEHTVRMNGYRDTKDLPRKIRIAVHELRNSGMLICTSSSSKGYWIARDYTEAQEFIGEMKGRASDIFTTASKLEKSAFDTFRDRTLRMF